MRDINKNNCSKIVISDEDDKLKMTAEKLGVDEHELMNIISVMSDTGLLSTCHSFTVDALMSELYTDTLTGLPNKKYAIKSIQDMLQAGNHDFSVLYIDVDGFKEVNDVFGHSVGDDVIKIMSMRFNGILRSGDECIRLHGDEFLVIAKNIKTNSDLEMIASKIISSIQYIEYKNNVFNMSCSVGICDLGTTYDSYTPEEIINKSDDAMYRAKNSGKNKFMYYSGR